MPYIISTFLLKERLFISKYGAENDIPRETYLALHGKYMLELCN